MELLELVRVAKDKKLNPFTPFQSLGEKLRLPISATFELTRRCNFKCDMCYMQIDNEAANRLGTELSADQWIDIARQTKELGTIHIAFTGGEVFTRKDFRYIYENIVDMGFLVSIFTNASLIDEEVISWLKMRKPFSISMTLYGASRETYESLCHNGDGYEKTMKALELLDAEKIPIILKNTITEKNSHDAAKIKALAESRGWRYAATDVLDIPRAEEQDTSDCTAVDQIGFCVDRCQLDDDQNRTVDRLLEMHDQVKEIARKKEGFSCTAGRSRYWITWYGKMMACASLMEPSANVLELGVVESWHRLKSQVAQLHNPSECLECVWFPICRQCPATHYLDNNHQYNKVSPRVCRVCERAFREKKIISCEEEV